MEQGTPNRFMTVSAFLKLLNRDETKVFSREYFYGLLKKKVLPSTKVGGKILVDPDAVFKAMRESGR